MTTWIRFTHSKQEKFGTCENGIITVHQGNMLDNPARTVETIPLDQTTLLTPCNPSKILGIWNNFNATSAKTGLPHPEHPWYFTKTSNTYAAANTLIQKPASCNGKVLFEGELGVVIGKTCKEIETKYANDFIFGYTCVNDVTAFEFLFAEEAFAHWTRAKCFDGFGVFGPGITTGITPENLVIKTFLEGDDQIQERQNYPVSDMLYSPDEIVSRISHDMTLYPGDVIACGTSVGAGAMKDGWTVRISIEGVGELSNVYSAS